MGKWVRCCVDGCEDDISKRHRFPKNKKTLFQMWGNIIKPKDWQKLSVKQIYNRYYVCDAHFEDHYKLGGRRGLTIDAVPTLGVSAVSNVCVDQPSISKTNTNHLQISQPKGLQNVMKPRSQEKGVSNVSDDLSKHSSTSASEMQTSQSEGLQRVKEPTFEGNIPSGFSIRTIMVMCWAPGCSHYNVRETCKFYRFPKDPKIRRRWITLSRRVDEPGPGAFICSCHFPDGKEANGPQQFLYNQNKSFNFPNSENRHRKPKKFKTSCTNTKPGPTSNMDQTRVPKTHLQEWGEDNTDIEECQDIVDQSISDSIQARITESPLQQNEENFKKEQCRGDLVNKSASHFLETSTTKPPFPFIIQKISSIEQDDDESGSNFVEAQALDIKEENYSLDHSPDVPATSFNDSFEIAEADNCKVEQDIPLSPNTTSPRYEELLKHQRVCSRDIENKLINTTNLLEKVVNGMTTTKPPKDPYIDAIEDGLKYVASKNRIRCLTEIMKIIEKYS